MLLLQPSQHCGALQFQKLLPFQGSGALPGLSYVYQSWKSHDTSGAITSPGVQLIFRYRRTDQATHLPALRGRTSPRTPAAPGPEPAPTSAGHPAPHTTPAPPSPAGRCGPPGSDSAAGPTAASSGSPPSSPRPEPDRRMAGGTTGTTPARTCRQNERTPTAGSRSTGSEECLTSAHKPIIFTFLCSGTRVLVRGRASCLKVRSLRHADRSLPAACVSFC